MDCYWSIYNTWLTKNFWAIINELLQFLLLWVEIEIKHKEFPFLAAVNIAPLCWNLSAKGDWGAIHPNTVHLAACFTEC